MRSLIMRLGAVLMTALLAIGLFSAPAHAEPATLSGTITSDATGEPVSGCVTVYDTEFNYAGNTCSDEVGSWSLDVEAGVSYKVEVRAYDGRHVGEWAQDAASVEEAESFVAPAVVDVSLRAGGTIGGTLRRADGSPADGAWVSVIRASDLSYVATTSVGGPPAGGDEWSALVPPGEYIVEFWDGTSNQWAIGQTSAETATRFTVAADATTRVDDRFLGNGRVRGTIVSDASGDPIEGACVHIIRPTNDPQMIDYLAEGCTGADGSFATEFPAVGTFAALIQDPEGRFVAEFSGDTRVIGQAETFEVTRETPAVVNASLATGSTLTGRAVDAKSGAAIQGACAGPFDGRAGGFIRWVKIECSSADGRWAIKGLPAGQFAVSVDAHSEPRVYATTWAFKATSQATASLISVPAASTKTVRDVQMMPGGTISGTITGPTGEPVADAYVSIDSGYSGRAGGPTGPVYARTDETGRYTVYGVPPGDHTVFVEPFQWGGLAPQWSGSADRREDALALRIKANRNTPFNATLSPGAQLKGSVVTAEGQPTTYDWIGIIRTTTGDYIGDFDVYNGNTFSSTSLPPGDFTLELRRYTESGDEEIVWYDSATSEADATVVSLERGETKDITVHLP
ncbi:carboxypeptidase regulatory-like domain-containing protein [Knoellia sp. CPCC 206453]|uniref:carboxypeptidase regulatory-like domain-containing protein n=1 Tax=Knoellia pratensis TaxID=3404796 RepID=UPI0036103FE6